MKIKDFLAFRWARKTQWPKPKPIEIHTRHRRAFSMPGDRRFSAIEDKWRRDAEDANRSEFPSRRARLQAQGLWKKQSRAERKRAEVAKRAGDAHENRRISRKLPALLATLKAMGLGCAKVIEAGNKADA